MDEAHGGMSTPVKHTAEWQLIETAPLDGSWFLGFRPSRYGVEDTIDVWHLAKNEVGVFWQNAADNALDLAPTHWMPLPAAPSLATPVLEREG